MHDTALPRSHPLSASSFDLSAHLEHDAPPPPRTTSRPPATSDSVASLGAVADRGRPATIAPAAAARDASGTKRGGSAARPEGLRIVLPRPETSADPSAAKRGRSPSPNSVLAPTERTGSSDDEPAIIPVEYEPPTPRPTSPIRAVERFVPAERLGVDAEPWELLAFDDPPPAVAGRQLTRPM